MKKASVARAAYANLFLESMEDTGFSTAEPMSNHGIPEALRERPDALFANAPFLKFLVEYEHRIDVPCLAYHGARRLRLSHFSRPVQQRIEQASTVLMALNSFAANCRIENSLQSFSIIDTGGDVIWITSQPKLGCLQPYSNWLQNSALIAIIRSFVGPTWTPGEIAFMCDEVHCEDVRKDFPNTRFRFNQALSWITVPRTCLSTGRRSDLACQRGTSRDDLPALSESLSSEVVGLLRGYVGSTTAYLNVIAECFEMSPRSLQRMLREEGTSLRELHQNSRLLEARRLLKNPDLKIIDVAIAVGFDDPANFSRFFRQGNGMSPREFRRI